MFEFSFSQALTANQLGFNPFSGSQYEFLPEGIPHRIKAIIRATGVSARLTLYSGSETIKERSPIQGGGTAGVIPSELNTTPQVWDAPGGDRLKMSIDEVGGLTPTVDGSIAGVELL